MRNILFIAFLAISNFISAQDKLNQFDEKGLRHGLWKGYHEESKRPRYEGTFEHGKEIGTFKYFDDTKAGTVIATRDFSKEDGSCYTIFYDQKNNKVSEGLVKNKLFEGEWKYYHKESKDIMTLEFYKNGKLNGVRKVFYKNNIIAEEVTYVDGKKNGVAKTYGENKKIINELVYGNDELNGKATYYNANGDGSKLYDGEYKNNTKVGVWKFYENGKVVKTVKAEKFSKELLKFEEKIMRKAAKTKKAEPNTESKVEEKK
jgi:antitoxin component YwqK of YwqJK toxin-antitoxin module